MGNEFLYLPQCAVLQTATYSITRLHDIIEIGTEFHLELDVTQQVADNLGITAFWNLQLVIDAQFGHDLAIMFVIVDNTLYNTYAITVGIDGA